MVGDKSGFVTTLCPTFNTRHLQLFRGCKNILTHTLGLCCHGEATARQFAATHSWGWVSRPTERPSAHSCLTSVNDADTITLSITLDRIPGLQPPINLLWFISSLETQALKLELLHAKIETINSKTGMIISLHKNEDFSQWGSEHAAVRETRSVCWCWECPHTEWYSCSSHSSNWSTEPISDIWDHYCSICSIQIIVIVAQIRCLRTQSSATVDFISTNGSVKCCLTRDAFYATWNCENSSDNCSFYKSISQWIKSQTKWYMQKSKDIKLSLLFFIKALSKLHKELS